MVRRSCLGFLGDVEIMIVLAFDTAIKTGCAWGAAGSIPTTCTVDLGKAEWDVRFARCLRMVEKLIVQVKPDLIVVEAPAAGGYTNADLVGLTVCVRAQAARMGIRSKSYFANSVRKHFLGKALKAKDFPGKSHAAAKGAIKAQVIARCLALGWDITDADAADAASLWDYACALESRSHQMTSLPGMFAGKR